MQTNPVQHDLPLPSPGERPGGDVVIYDGACRICRAQARRLVWWDCQSRLAYLSLHDDRATALCPDLSGSQRMNQMIVIDRRGRRWEGADAIKYLTVRLRRLWWLAPLFWLPGAMWIWRPAYRWIAGNRYRFGRVPECDDGCECSRAPSSGPN